MCNGLMAFVCCVFPCAPMLGTRLLDVDEQVKLRNSLRPGPPGFYNELDEWICDDLCRHKIHKFVRARFPRRPWLDVISKIDVEEEEAKALAKNFVNFVNPLQLPLASLWRSAAFFVATCTTGQYFQAVGSWVSQQRCSQTKWRQSNGSPRMDLFPDALQALKMTWSWLWDDLVSRHFDHLFVQCCCESFHWGKRLWWHWPGWLEYGGPWLDVGSCWSTRFECSNLRCVDCWKRWQRRP